ncbi:hypothetical protein WISP_138716 [Willisornis vidua]|uniref:Uncharacterized protein n=1 Tax=Willisornis vidua TaxID=1566151 RepID=A0ABQ9CML5_9PASS|nr:hypothetical protein WISP_138716 [Willisornis vidua]
MHCHELVQTPLGTAEPVFGLFTDQMEKSDKQRSSGDTVNVPWLDKDKCSYFYILSEADVVTVLISTMADQEPKVLQTRPAHGSIRVTILGKVQKTCECDTWGHGDTFTQVNKMEKTHQSRLSQALQRQREIATLLILKKIMVSISSSRQPVPSPQLKAEALWVSGDMGTLDIPLSCA